jgi:hypothetical protein
MTVMISCAGLRPLVVSGNDLAKAYARFEYRFPSSSKAGSCTTDAVRRHAQTRSFVASCIR